MDLEVDVGASTRKLTEIIEATREQLEIHSTDLPAFNAGSTGRAFRRQGEQIQALLLEVHQEKKRRIHRSIAATELAVGQINNFDLTDQSFADSMKRGLHR